MNRKTVLVFLVLSVGSVSAAIYRSVDEQGNTVFSDQPAAGSQPLKLPPVPIYSAPSLSPVSPADTAVKEGRKSIYSVFTVLAPGKEQAFWDNAGNVSVRLSLQPELKTGHGHRIQFYLDGKSQGQAGTALETVIENVDRGQHQVYAAVLDAAGKEVIRTPSVSFQLHRQSVNSPARKARPSN